MYQEILEEPTIGTSEEKVDYIDYEDQLARWIDIRAADLLVELYLAATYSYDVNNEMVITKESFDKLCSWLNLNFHLASNNHKWLVKKSDLLGKTCSLTVAPPGKKPKLGENFPPWVDDLIRKLDAMDQIKGSYKTCLDS